MAFLIAASKSASPFTAFEDDDEKFVVFVVVDVVVLEEDWKEEESLLEEILVSSSATPQITCSGTVNDMLLIGLEAGTTAGGVAATGSAVKGTEKGAARGGSGVLDRGEACGVIVRGDGVGAWAGRVGFDSGLPRDSTERRESLDAICGAILSEVFLSGMGDGVARPPPSASLFAAAVNLEILSLRLSFAGSSAKDWTRFKLTTNAGAASAGLAVGGAEAAGAATSTTGGGGGEAALTGGTAGTLKVGLGATEGGGGGAVEGLGATDGGAGFGNFNSGLGEGLGDGLGEGLGEGFGLTTGGATLGVSAMIFTSGWISGGMEASGIEATLGGEAEGNIDLERTSTSGVSGIVLISGGGGDTETDPWGTSGLVMDKSSFVGR